MLPLAAPPPLRPLLLLLLLLRSFSLCSYPASASNVLCRPLLSSPSPSPASSVAPATSRSALLHYRQLLPYLQARKPPLRPLLTTPSPALLLPLRRHCFSLILLCSVLLSLLQQPLPLPFFHFSQIVRRSLVNHDATAPTAPHSHCRAVSPVLLFRKWPAPFSPAFIFAPASDLDGGFPVSLQPPLPTAFPIFAARVLRKPQHH
ncbi:hypothetical protein PIB30_048146 [Stylosanthes scabra]|uniref:Secreted protein n=1 Tax=Stylosanthes scabra TaxID=79078 RepID=A0ABU6UHK3_9FABA|nr:hypothetical protein [Stylosanthes scabra]